MRVKELVDALILGLQRFFEVGFQVAELSLADLLEVGEERVEVVAADCAVKYSRIGKNLRYIF